MRALTWQGRRDVRVETVPDPKIERADRRRRPDHLDRDLRVATCTCTRCSGPYLSPGDVLGHEPMGIVEEVGAEVTHIRPGDRVVVPFNISCGSCWMCSRELYAQCETTQVRDAGQGRGAVRLHLPVRLGAGRPGRVPAGAAGALRPDQGPGRHRRTSGSLYLSDVLPTAWQAVAVRRRARGRHPGRARPRPDRPDGAPHRPAPRGRAGDRGRSRGRAARAGRARTASRSSTCARSTTSPTR